MVVTLRIGVGHKFHTAISLTFITSLVRRVMLRALAVAVLLSLPCLVIIRLGILGTIRISILYQSSHEGPHVSAMALHPS